MAEVSLSFLGKSAHAIIAKVFGMPYHKAVKENREKTTTRRARIGFGEENFTNTASILAEHDDQQCVLGVNVGIDEGRVKRNISPNFFTSTVEMLGVSLFADPNPILTKLCRSSHQLPVIIHQK